MAEEVRRPQALARDLKGVQPGEDGEAFALADQAESQNEINVRRMWVKMRSMANEHEEMMLIDRESTLSGH